jgi:hypothetical protein
MMGKDEPMRIIVKRRRSQGIFEQHRNLFHVPLEFKSRISICPSLNTSSRVGSRRYTWSHFNPAFGRDWLVVYYSFKNLSLPPFCTSFTLLRRCFLDMLACLSFCWCTTVLIKFLSLFSMYWCRDSNIAATLHSVFLHSASYAKTCLRTWLCSVKDNQHFSGVFLIGRELFFFRFFSQVGQRAL